MKISELPLASAPAGTELVPIVQSGVTRKVAVSAFTSGAWAVIGTAGKPGFENAWVNYTADAGRSAAYKITPGGDVELRGIISTGTIGLAAFTLPVAPTGDRVFPVVSNAAFGRVTVNASGAVIPTNPSVNTWVTLDGIRFSIV